MTIINFVVYDECENVTNPVAYDEDVIIQTFLKEYVKKYTNYESLDTKIYVFKNGLKILNSQKYLNEKIGTHIKDGAQITFLRKMGLHYSI
jgi:hypothetical protein